jgi:hypothetical protein
MSLGQGDVLTYVQHISAEIMSVPDPALRADLLRDLRKETNRRVREAQGATAYEMRTFGASMLEVAQTLHTEKHTAALLLREYCRTNGVEIPGRHYGPLHFLTPPGSERG